MAIPLRLTVSILAIAAPLCLGASAGQGSPASRAKAGDEAPAITASTVSAPASKPGGAPRLDGQLTFLAFFPRTSLNQNAAATWNTIASEFADKPVQFVWITAEEKQSLVPLLKNHPIQGWVLFDPKDKTATAYDLEGQLGGVLIGTDGKILAFDRFGLPSAELLNAALEDENRTDRSARTGVEDLIERRPELLSAEAPRPPGPEDHKPAFAPSNTLHITPSKAESTGTSSGPDFLVLQKYTLRSAITYIYETSFPRIVLPAAADTDETYDFALVTPQPESSEKLKEIAQRGLEAHFRLASFHELQSVKVYVMTAVPDHPPPAGNTQPSSNNRISSTSLEFSSPRDSPPGNTYQPRSLNDLRGIAFNGSIEELRLSLEGVSHSPVLDETGLQGDYSFDLRPSENASVPERLRTQFGIALTPETRVIDILHFQLR